MKKSHFLGDWWFLCDLLCHFWWIFGWDWGTPAILRQNLNIYGQFQGKLGFGQFWKKVGIGSNSQLLPKICFRGSPKRQLIVLNNILSLPESQSTEDTLSCSIGCDCIIHSHFDCVGARVNNYPSREEEWPTVQWWYRSKSGFGQVSFNY